jgi:LPS sulfotransferase NodH
MTSQGHRATCSENHIRRRLTPDLFRTFLRLSTCILGRSSNCVSDIVFLIMQGPRMKGVLILTEGRSGSNWLGSLLESSGNMGVPSEWFNINMHNPRPQGPDELIRLAVDKASTPNGRFVIKIFPRHLTSAHALFGVDLLREMRQRYDVGAVRLGRADRLRQAISYAKAIQSREWVSGTPKEARQRPQYNFKDVAEAYFLIEKSESFWNAYLDMARFAPEHFVYENLVEDPGPFVNACARLLDVQPQDHLTSNLKVQRDQATEDWVDRFRNDLTTKSPLAHASGRPASRNLRNLKRFLAHQALIGD